MRARIDFLRPERHQLLRRGNIACVFDELTIDTPRNRFVLTALLVIALLVKSKELAHKCRQLATVMSDTAVVTQSIGRFDTRATQITRNDSHDKPMLDAARLAIALALPLEDGGPTTNGIHSTNQLLIGDLFERTVGGFDKVVLPKALWRVTTGEALTWPITGESATMRPLVPIMITDIVITDRVRDTRLTIDTKFKRLTKLG